MDCAYRDYLGPYIDSDELQAQFDNNCVDVANGEKV